MKVSRTYRMDMQTLAKLAALRSTNPSQNDTELIKIAVDLLFAKGAPVLNMPTQEDLSRFYWQNQATLDQMNVLDTGLEQQRALTNEVYMLALDRTE